MKLFQCGFFMFQQCLYTYVVHMIIFYLLLCLPPDGHITVSLIILDIFCFYEQ